MNRVVIVGAGFGGLAAAKHLDGDGIEVTVVDRHNYHTFQPLLYQVATSGLSAADVAYPVRGVFHGRRNVAFRNSDVTGVDWAARTLELDHGSQPALGFDHLIVAAGATAAYFGIPGAAEHAHPLYTLDDAVTLRARILERFEAADADPSTVDDGALTFVIVGGGPTGVEVAGAISELVDRVLRKDYPHLDVGKARVILVEMGEGLLQAFSRQSGRNARERLVDMGVDVRTGEAVAEVTATRVTLAGGAHVAAHTLIWAAGVQASPLAAVLGLGGGPSGRIRVGTDLRIEGHPEAFAIGDIAAIPDVKHPGALLPMLAPVAMQSGAHVAAEIKRAIRGEAPKPLRYLDKGIMATIGRHAAVAELPLGLRLTGGPAWFAWLGLHLITLAGFRNRLSVFLNWAWNYFTWDRGPRLIFERNHDDNRR